MHILQVLPDQGNRVPVALIQQDLDLLIHDGRSLLGAVQAIAAVQILVPDGAQGHHAELVAHAEHGHHVPGDARGLLNILRGSVGHGVHHHFLRRPAAHGDGDLGHQLVLGAQVGLILLRHQQGIAQRPLGVGNDGDLLHRLGVLLLIGHHGVAHLVVGHQLLLKLSEHRIFLLTAGDDELKGGQQVLLGHQAAAKAHRPQGGLVHQVGQIRAHAPGGGQGDLFQIDVLRQLDLPGVDLEGGQATGQVGPVDGDAPVKAAGAQQRLVQHLRAVGGAQDDDALARVEAVQLRQQLVQGLLPLVVAPHAVVTGLADGVDLVDEDDTGGHLGRFLKQVADTGRAHAYEHLHKVGAADGEERHVGLAGHSLGQQGLTSARRAHQQGALGQLGANLGVLLGVVEDVDDLLEGLLGLVLAGHIPEGDPGLFLHIDLGVGLAQVAHSADAALSAHAEHEQEQSHHHQDGQDIGQEQVEQIGGIVHRLGVGAVRQVLLQLVHQFHVGYSAQPDGHILRHRRLVLRRFRKQGVHQIPRAAGLLLLGQLHLDPLPEGEGDLPALHIGLLDLVRLQPLLEGGVRHLHHSGVLIGGPAASEQERQEQRPQDDADQSQGIALVVPTVVVVSFIWFQGRIPPSCDVCIKFGPEPGLPLKLQQFILYHTIPLKTRKSAVNFL